MKARRLFLFALVLLVLLAAGAAFVFRQIIVIDMPGASYRGALPPMTPAQRLLAERLEGDVDMLAGQIGERNLFRRGTLERAARHIEQSFEAAGHEVRSRIYEVRGQSVRNVEAVIPGTDPGAGLVVVGAHYDTAPGSPGANDNASGTAALVAIGRALEKSALRRGIRLVAFVNEEAPFSYTKAMGSVRYAEELARRGETVVAMLSLETLGYYTDAADSQRYPFPMSYFYPDTGNFVGFVGNPPSRDLVRRAVRSFRENARFPSEGLAAPERIRGVGWSDHWSFWQQGWPAVMVTDTALYRYRQYHTADDTPAILTYERFARVVDGLVAVVVDLASR